jgi:HlyD family secretion protein
VLGSVTLWWWHGRDPPLRYVTARVSRGDIQRTVTMTGALNPVVTAQVESYVSGDIKAWYCDYNAPVKIGQLCALIDPLPFQVVVDQDTAQLHSGMAQLAKDRVGAANQATVYAFDQKLIGQGIVSQETINTDKAVLDQDRAQLQLDQASVAQQQAALHGARVNLGYTKILSPVNGMVITRYIDVGQTVVSSLSASPLFLIGKDMHVMQVDTNVSEADVGGVKPGQPVYFTVQAFPNRTFSGHVRQIREGPITVQNVVTYDVVVDVPNDDLSLFPGMTADAHIITALRRNVLRVPLPAIRFNPAGLAGAAAGERGGRRGGAPAGAGGRGTPAAARAGGRGAGATGQGRGRPFAANAGAAAQGADAERNDRATLWLLRDGKLIAARVRTGLDDGTLIEVSGEELRQDDVVVVNADKPGAAATAPQTGNRTGGGLGFRGGLRL